MRNLIRHFLFLMAAVSLVVLVVAMIRSYQQPSMRHRNSGAMLSCWISSRGEFHWLSLRMLDASWVFTDAAMVGGNFTYDTAYTAPPKDTGDTLFATGGVVGISSSFSGGMGSMTLSGGYVPWWHSTTLDPPEFPNSPTPPFPSQHYKHLSTPYWYPIALAAIVTGVSGRSLLRSYRQRRFWKSGRCLNCGYDLRASADRCPECGAMIVARPEAALTAH
jgi:hypothetical protein